MTKAAASRDLARRGGTPEGLVEERTEDCDLSLCLQIQLLISSSQTRSYVDENTSRPATMPSSTGTELPKGLQVAVDHHWVKCVTCPILARQATWDAGVNDLKAQAGTGVFQAAMEDALQDAGFRLGIFHLNAQAARFYGAPLGVAS